MSYRRRRIATIAASLGGLLLLVLLAAAWRVFDLTHPPRRDDADPQLTRAMMRVEEVAFPASDGTNLSGWMLEGQPEAPVVVMAHALGGSKTSHLDLAALLQREGFHVLVFDFRGHGASGGEGSSLGLEEKHDLIGAIDFVADRHREAGTPIGLFAVGMGAHAAVLAGAERPDVKVMVLDGLYPEAGYPLVEAFFGPWDFGVEHLGFVPRAVFSAIRRGAGATRAADRIGELLGRDILLLAPAGDAALASAMQEMYESIPEQRYADGNLVLLPATRTSDLYGEELRLYEDRVVRFFDDRLRRH